MKTITITIRTDDGFELPALHVPGNSPEARPLVLIQEIFGLNAAMKQAAQAWSALGFDVVCPDLFARQQPAVDLDPAQPEQFQAGVALMQGLDQERAVCDLDAARQWFAASGRESVNALGYCLGGRLAVMMALSTPIAAAVSYYGVGLEGLISPQRTAMAPCLLHIAELDAFLSPEARQTILANAAQQDRMPAHVYDGCDHAFARPDGQHYDAAAAELAQSRTLAFLRG